ncbi:MAG TPA: GtrA family protein [Candidatus Paceibacterota bacterium]
MIAIYQKIKAFWWKSLERIHPSLHNALFRYRIYIKYLISGGSAATSNLGSLFILVELFDIHYLSASVLAFIAGFLVSFILQKYFTFGDTTIKTAHRQLMLYLIITVANLGLNTFIVYTLVDVVGLWYFTAQFLAGIVVSTESFVLYKHFIFNRKQPLTGV